MAHQSELIASDIHAYLKSQEEKSMLRFITCGSVDDGKSTLIGRLLWDSKLIFEDQLAALQADSRRVGTQGEEIDYALLLDGLQAEREQGITIDVAYRFFSTDKRKFIVADTPGHEQYTRNMVTGASTAQVAVILIDARKGVLTQTRRHSYLVSLVGIRKVVLAVNKMDLVDYSAERFAEIRREYEAFAADLGFTEIAPIPISALKGDNVIEPSANTPWHQGPTLLEYLETVRVPDAAAEGPFRLRVQWVNRPNLDFRGYCGTIASGVVRPGDELFVTSSGQKSRVARIVTMDGDLAEAGAGQAVTLTLTDEIDISRGDLLASAQTPPLHANRIETHVVWLHEEPLRPGRSYLLKAGASTAPAQISEVKHKINVNTLQPENGRTLDLNEVAVCNILLSRPLSFDTYQENQGTGSFILIDRMNNATVAAGMIHAPLQETPGEDHGSLDTGRRSEAGDTLRSSGVLWFSGPAGTGKSALAQLTEKKFREFGQHTYLLDGDSLRRRLSRDLGVTAADQAEHTRRLAEVARILVDAGLVVLASLSSPFRAQRRLAREILDKGEFMEVFVGPAPENDGDGSRPSGKVTGIDSAYEPAEFTLQGDEGSAEDLAERIVREFCR